MRFKWWYIPVFIGAYWIYYRSVPSAIGDVGGFGGGTDVPPVGNIRENGVFGNRPGYHLVEGMSGRGWYRK